ncbi:uncharacterized protein IL334_002824 [Kwoniella shivajii]|uniref:Endosomal/vacuolar adapter protein YPT35 n=1 Tax=Kwoniella shivajii TaxID=564305 RepID=A0ABZ1CVS8_9TREE|nr:hypothetical protein IL334_002824 [Kwoniella shivajii]
MSLSPPQTSTPLDDSRGRGDVNDTKPSSTLLLLPPSPTSSNSSLTSDETSFDHLALALNSTSDSRVKVTGTRDHYDGDNLSNAPILGLRDLVKMRKAEKIKSNLPISPPPTATIIEDRTVHVQDQNPPGYPGTITGTNTLKRNEVFAKQVVIRGWKIVGGNDWKDVGKLGAYVVYDIDIGLMNGGNINILRRYTDFVNLRNELKITYPSLKDAIPQLPGKAHFARFSRAFLEQRQPRLQRFLRAVVLHPEMGRGGDNSIVGDWVMGNSR